MKILGLGQINFWEGASLWIGLSKAPTEAHSHHAIQFSLGLKGDIRLRTGEGSDWVGCSAALVPSGVQHAFDGSGSVVANVLMEPESEIGEALGARYGATSIAIMSAEEAERARSLIREAYASGAPDHELNSAAREAVGMLVGGALPRKRIDDRIARAISAIAARIEGPIMLETIADQVHLSAERFRHLFVAETGVAFRPYVLWRRLQLALELAVAGASWTEAAHEAGFTDSAHLTRTFRVMFGVAPSALGRPEPEAGRAGLAGDSGPFGR